MPRAAHYHARFQEEPIARQAFHRPRNSLGSAAHYIREAGILAPLVISELVPDPQTKWNYIKMASLITALFSQGMWTARVHSERKRERERDSGHQRAP
jgi:hypothetical protein